MADSNRLSSVQSEPLTFLSDAYRLVGTLFYPKSPQRLFILVHPWTWLGGNADFMEGFAQLLAADTQSACLCFNLRGAGSSQGWASFTGSHREVIDVQNAAEVLRRRFPDQASQLFLLGYSAGACIAGSAAKACSAIGVVCLGYPCGNIASIAFSSHPAKLREYSGKRLLISGDSDGFTSEGQLRRAFNDFAETEIVVLKKIGHFDILHRNPRNIIEIVRAFIAN